MVLIGGILLGALVLFLGFSAFLAVAMFLIMKWMLIAAFFAGALVGTALFDSVWAALAGGVLGVVGLLGGLAFIGREKQAGG